MYLQKHCWGYNMTSKDNTLLYAIAGVGGLVVLSSTSKGQEIGKEVKDKVSVISAPAIPSIHSIKETVGGLSSFTTVTDTVREYYNTGTGAISGVGNTVSGFVSSGTRTVRDSLGISGDGTAEAYTTPSVADRIRQTRTAYDIGRAKVESGEIKLTTPQRIALPLADAFQTIVQPIAEFGWNIPSAIANVADRFNSVLRWF